MHRSAIPPGEAVPASVPRTRGCTVQTPHRGRPELVSPTHARMHRARFSSTRRVFVSPAHARMHRRCCSCSWQMGGQSRARADAPAVRFVFRLDAPSVPRTRGCTELLALALHVGCVSPADARMHRTRCSPSRSAGHVSPAHARMHRIFTSAQTLLEPSVPRTRGCTDRGHHVRAGAGGQSRVRANVPSAACKSENLRRSVPRAHFSTLATFLIGGQSRVRADAPNLRAIVMTIFSVSPACERMHRPALRWRHSGSVPRARGCTEVGTTVATPEHVSPACARMHRRSGCRADRGTSNAQPATDGPFTPSRLILACEDSHAPLSCAVGPILESVPRATPIPARARRARMVPTWAGTRTCRWTKTSGYPDGPSALIVVVLPMPAPPARMSRC